MTDNTAAADLVAMLGELSDPHKSGKVSAGQRQYTFLTLPDLLVEVRTRAAAHHLALTQTVSTTDTGHTTMETVLIHATGVRFTSGPWVMPDTPNPQAAGSQITYWRRYQLAAFVGLAGSDDDDGARATAHTTQAQEYAQTRPVTREAPDPADDPYYIDREPPPITGGAPAMSEFSERMPATQAQHGAIRGIAGMLGVGTNTDLVKPFVQWLLLKDEPNRPADLLMSKSEASQILSMIGVKEDGKPWAVSDEGKALAREYLGTMI